MATVVEPVKRARVYTEPNGSFAVEGSIGSFVDVPFVEDSWKLMLNRPMQTPGIIQQHLDGMPSKVFMPKSAQWDFATNFQALAARATGLAVENTLGKFFEIAMGGKFIGTGTTVNDASATVTSFVLTDASGFREGGAIAFATGTGGALECREIKTISTNTVTLKLALTSAPANSSVAYGCVTYYLDNTVGSAVQSLQAALEGLDSHDRWLLKGGQITSPPTFELTPGGIPRVSWSWLFAQWLYADGINTTMNLTSSPISDQNLSDIGINAVFDSNFLIQTHGTTTLSAAIVDAPQINIKPAFKYVPHKTPAGVNNIKQWIRERVAPVVAGDFVIPYDSTTWSGYRDAETARALTYQLGSGSTNGGVMISVPNLCFDDWQREGNGGIASQHLTWYGKLDSQTSTNSNNLQKSALRIHMF